MRGNVEQGVGETMAQLNEYNAISDRFAEPMSDDEMNELIERQGELQTQIDAVNGWDIDRHAGNRRRCAAPAALGRRSGHAVWR